MAGDYGPLLRQCVAEKLWIREYKIWWGQYNWADQYAHTWIQSVDKPTLADPFQLLREALLLIEQNPTHSSSNATMPSTNESWTTTLPAETPSSSSLWKPRFGSVSRA